MKINISLSSINELSEEDQIKAVKRYPSAIYDIKNPSEDVQLTAVNLQVGVFQYLKNPSEKIQLAAVKINGLLIKLIKDPSEAIQIEAIKQNSDAIKFIKKPGRNTLRIYRRLFATRKIGNHTNTDLSQHKHLDQDQIAVIRFMDLNFRTKITVKELKTEFNNSPTIQSLIRLNAGKDLSKDQVLNYGKHQVKAETIETLVLKNSRLRESMPWSKGQIIFPTRLNRTSILEIDLNKFISIVLTQRTNIDHTLFLEYKDNMEHPRSLKKNAVTLAWIRYTLFGKDVWIDEVQTDMDKIKNDKDTAVKLNWMKVLPEHMLKEFIRVMRSKGYEKFYMPTYELKNSLYTATPPLSIYKDLPKKMRFKREKARNISSRVNGKIIWSLSKSKVK